MIDRTHADGCHMWGREHYECALAKLEAVTKERDLLAAQAANLTAVFRANIIRAYPNMQHAEIDAVINTVFDKSTSERDALAAQVVALKADMLSINEYWNGGNGAAVDACHHACEISEKALSLDPAAAEAILREREAKRLEEVAEIFHCRAKSGKRDGIQLVSDEINGCLYATAELRRLAAERRACQECGMIGAHKLQCSTGGQTQLALPARREGK